MKYERKSAHTIYDHKYHLCWITKYRSKVLTKEIGERTRELIKQISKENDVEIISGNVRPEHIHILVSIPPHLSVSKFMQYVKGKTATKLLREFQILRKKYYGGHLWARGYYSATSGNITDETIQEYILNQDKEDNEDDKFIVSGSN